MQQRLASRASDLSRRIYASLPWGLRVANLFMVLASSTQDAFGRVVYAEFIKRGVEGMPDIAGEPASAWQERLLKLKTRAGDRVPRGYGLAFAKKVWGIAMGKARDPNLVEDVMVRAMEKLLKMKPDTIREGAPLPEAEGFIISMVKNDILDQFRAQKRRPQLGLGEKDEEGDYSGDVLDPNWGETYSRAGLERTLQEARRDLEGVHPDAAAYIDLSLQGYPDKEILLKLDMKNTKGTPMTPQTWEFRYKDKIREVLRKHMEKSAAFQPGYGMDQGSLRIRQGAYNIAKDISTGKIDVTVAPRTKQLAKKYFDLEDRSGTASQREEAARALYEQLDTELSSAKIAVRILGYWTESFGEAAGVHHNLAMTE